MVSFGCVSRIDLVSHPDQCQRFAEICLLSEYLIEHFPGRVINRLSVCTQVPPRGGTLWWTFSSLSGI